MVSSPASGIQTPVTVQTGWSFGMFTQPCQPDFAQLPQGRRSQWAPDGHKGMSRGTLSKPWPRVTYAGPGGRSMHEPDGGPRHFVPLPAVALPECRLA